MCAAAAEARERDRTCTSFVFCFFSPPQSLCESLKNPARDMKVGTGHRKKMCLIHFFNLFYLSRLHETFRLEGDAQKKMAKHEPGFDDITHKHPCGTCGRVDVTTRVCWRLFPGRVSFFLFFVRRSHMM